MRRKPDKSESAADVPEDSAAKMDVGRTVESLGVERIVSGGQTGVDRGALDAAITLGIEHGGWCPRGRLAEDGPIPPHYRLHETEALEYAVRTERNVIDSDGTLVVYKGRLQRGSLLTYRLAQKHARPVLRVRLDLPVDVAEIQQWLIEQRIRVLNVAGPRASSCPGIDLETAQLLTRVFTLPLQGSLFNGQA
jgi:hypothetical protein